MDLKILSKLFQQTKPEETLDDELRFHLEREVEQNLSRGMADGKRGVAR